MSFSTHHTEIKPLALGKRRCEPPPMRQRIRWRIDRSCIVTDYSREVRP